MNNIYVDELPNSCDGCCFNNDSYCVNNEYVIENYFTQTKHPKCPLKLLTEALAEERKKVVQEIKDKISDGLYRNSYGETFIDGDIYEILDQIERNIDG